MIVEYLPVLAINQNLLELLLYSKFLLIFLFQRKFFVYKIVCIKTSFIDFLIYLRWLVCFFSFSITTLLYQLVHILFSIDILIQAINRGVQLQLSYDYTCGYLISYFGILWLYGNIKYIVDSL